MFIAQDFKTVFDADRVPSVWHFKAKVGFAELTEYVNLGGLLVAESDAVLRLAEVGAGVLAVDLVELQGLDVLPLVPPSVLAPEDSSGRVGVGDTLERDGAERLLDHVVLRADDPDLGLVWKKKRENGNHDYVLKS